MIGGGKTIGEAFWQKHRY